MTDMAERLRKLEKALDAIAYAWACTADELRYKAKQALAEVNDE